MGQAFGKLFDTVFSNPAIKVAILGLDNAGKTTIMYRLHLGEVVPTIPTIGVNVENFQYKNERFTMFDIGMSWRGSRMIREHYFRYTDGLIFVVDSVDRERIGEAKEDFQNIIKHPFLVNNVILVLANKQEMEGAMTPKEVCEALGLYDVKNFKWHIQSTCALNGEGLNEGLAWFTAAIKDFKATGHHLSIRT